MNSKLNSNLLVGACHNKNDEFFKEPKTQELSVSRQLARYYFNLTITLTFLYIYLWSFFEDSDPDRYSRYEEEDDD